MGYLRDQQGIMTRYLREAPQWKEHLDRSRAFIQSTFPAGGHEGVKKGTLVVLGSGWLLDVPLDHLLNIFSKVYLVDIYHPPQIRKKMENRDNVILLEADISGGGIEQVWQFCTGKGPDNAFSIDCPPSTVAGNNLQTFTP